MLGSKDVQYIFADADNWHKRIPKNSFYYQVRQRVGKNLNDEQLQREGRPSFSPTRMLTAIIIQLEKGCSDCEMNEAA